MTRLTAPKLVFLLIATLTTPIAVAQDQHPVKKLILPGESFLVEKRPAFILLPPEDKRAKPQPWIMYAPTLPGLPDGHEKWMHEQFLAAGVAVAGVDAGEAYGSPAGQKLMSSLYEELTKKRGFARRPCLLGRSRGGLFVSSWAISNHDKVAGIAGIYPVFDLRSYPGLAKAAPAYGLTVPELESRLADHNPIARIDVLAKAKLPIYIIHGDNDKVVPLQANSAAVVDRYKNARASDAVTLVVAEGQGHNYWQGFFRCQELVDFAIKRAKAGTQDRTSENESAASGSSTADRAVAIKDLEYSRAGDKPLQLDLYRPENPNGQSPVVMWVHGGGWKNGSKNRCPANWLVEHGYAVASINYRLTDEAQWPAQIDDCRAAVRWLRTNGDKYGLDADRIGAWGGSAGGHLVALLGTLDAPKDEAVSSRVQAVCDWYGPSDLLTMPPNVLSPNRTEDDLAKSNGAKLLGGTVRNLPDLAKQASALYQVSKDDPPFLIMHGDKDPGVPLEQSQRLHDKLRAAGVASILHVVKGAGHGGKAFQSPEARQVVLAFFNEHLQGKLKQAERKPGGPSIVWVTPETDKDSPFTAGVSHHTFESQVAKQAVGYTIYLPPGYQEATHECYPVIYNLHGNGGNERKGLESMEVLHEGITKGWWPPMIMVRPNGGRSTFYKDSADGKFPIETMFIKELIPYIDATYRTIAARHGRCIEGFSMGGRGSTRLAVKYPDMFCSLFCQAGNVPRISESYDPTKPDEYPNSYLGTDEQNYLDNDAFVLLEKNLDRIKDRLRIMIACGTRDTTHIETIRDFHAALQEQGVDHTYLEIESLKHERTKMLQMLKPILFDYHVESMRRAREQDAEK